MANKTNYGLANAVMSADTARCRRVSSQLQSGIVWENCNQVRWRNHFVSKSLISETNKLQALYVNTPFGGKKQSGFGRELGEAGLEEYVHVKTIV